jgi:hypothetical protein
MNRAELELIARTAAEVRPRGVIVEIGSFAGRSSVHWAANSDPTVAVYCMDPFDTVCCDEYSLKHIQGDATNARGRTAGELFAEHTRPWAHRLTRWRRHPRPTGGIFPPMWYSSTATTPPRV